MSYAPRAHYTDAELLAFEIADLETDLRCAVRDGLTEYADIVRARLVAKRAPLPECSICRRRHGREVTHACE